MRQTLLFIAILSALSVPGFAGAEVVGFIDTENRVNPPGTAPKGLTYQKIEWLKSPTPRSSTGDQPELQRRLQSPRDSASGLPTGKR